MQFFRYELPNLKEWAEVHLSQRMAEGNMGQIFSLAWKYKSDILLHASFKKLKLGLDEVKKTKEWKEDFQGAEEFAAELIRKF